MNSQTTTATQTAADEDAIRAIHQRMIDAWNVGDGAGFATSFTEDANFVAFEGTHLKGRQEIALFHQGIFDTVVKGSLARTSNQRLTQVSGGELIAQAAT